MMSEKKDWLQAADDYVNERERSLLTAIEEVERIEYAYPEVYRLDESHKTTLCYLAGAVYEVRKFETHLNWLIQKREEEG